MTGRLLRSGNGRAVPGLSRCAGFTYLGLLFVVAVMGIVMAVAAQVWQTSVQRERERELLFVGNQLRMAIKSYYDATPGADKQFPQQLEDLLLDPRAPGIRRHLRKRYLDPITGKPEWGLIMAEEGGIQGFYSLSSLAPVKQAGFEEENAEFEKKLRYSDWKFLYFPEPAENADATENEDGDAAESEQ